MILRRLGIEPRHLALFFVALLLDQATKIWAYVRFQGVPRFDRIEVIGDLWRFELAFNEGSAFSLRPQDVLPWMPQTLFYMLLGAVAVTLLCWFYRRIDPADRMSRSGVILVLAGAVGNLVDRVRLGKVIDFVDWDFPDVAIGSWALRRWPTFNVADVCVLAGVGLILLAPVFLKRKKREAERP